MFEQDPESPLTGPQRELERALTGLKPSPPVFALGDVRAAALLRRQRIQTRIWQAVAAALALGLATLAILRPSPSAPQPQRIAHVLIDNAPPSPSHSPAPLYSEPARPIPAGFAYLQMRHRVLLLGADALRANRPAVTSTHAAPFARWAPGGADALPGDRARPADDHRSPLLDLLLPGGKT